VDHAADRRGIDKPVQHLPPAAAQPPDHPCCRRDRERHHQHERGEPDRDERTLVDVAADRHQQVPRGRPRHDAVGERDEPREAVQDHVGQEVEHAVEEGVEPQHATEPDELVPAGQPPQRRDGERDGEKPQRPDPGLVGDVAERVGAEVARQGGPRQVDRRAQAGQEDDRFENEADDIQ
jgi:hypothetical protein